MSFTEHPRLLARVAGVFYLIITVFALFAYLYVRGRVIIPGDMAQTATKLLAQEQLYRLGFSAAVIVVICNLPLGWILFELLKVVNPRLALLALLFITVAATIEAVNLFNYVTPLFTVSLPGKEPGDEQEEYSTMLLRLQNPARCAERLLARKRTAESRIASPLRL